MKLERGNRVVVAPACLQAPGEPPMLVIGTVLELNEARGRIALEVDIRGGRDYFQVDPADLLRRSTPEDEGTMPGGELLPEGNVEVQVGPDGEGKKLTAREMDYLHALERGGSRARQADMTSMLKEQLADLNPATGNSPAAVAARRRELSGRILCALIYAPKRGVSLLNSPELAVELADLLLAALDVPKKIY